MIASDRSVTVHTFSNHSNHSNMTIDQLLKKVKPKAARQFAVARASNAAAAAAAAAAARLRALNWRNRAVARTLKTPVRLTSVFGNKRVLAGRYSLLTVR